jgi:hypothetical protein
MQEIDWSLFDSQEQEIESINNELLALRREKYPEYRDSYYKYYKEFGMRGMVGDLYRKFDRLKIMSTTYSDVDIAEKEKEITDQYYDLISYLQLQLYFLRKEKWRNHTHTFTPVGENVTSGYVFISKKDVVPKKGETWNINEPDCLSEEDINRVVEKITDRIQCSLLNRR